MIDYQKIFEGAPALFVLLGADESFRILDASDAYLRATHSERDAIVGRSLFEVFPDNPEDPEATGATNLRASLKRILADGRPDTMAVQKYDVRRPAGAGGGFEERYWSPVNAPVFGPDGRMLFIVHRVEDVTKISRSNRASAPQGETMRLEVMLRAQELQEANRQLREVTEQFQAIYDQGLFAARLRLDGTVLDANRSAVEVCGFDRADILDKPFWECGWWNRSPEVQAWVRNAVEQAVAGELFRGESLYFWGDGSEHIVDFACVPVRDATGRVVVVVTTGMDVTERVRAEQNQRELETERRRAEALAEIDRGKTQFFANISHEFRTPLTLMLGSLEEMKRESAGAADPPPHYGQMDLVHRNCLRLLKLVNNLLDFSRIEAGRMQVSFEPVDLAIVTAELASNFHSAVEKAGLRLVVDCPSLPQPVYIDIDMWEKVVLNLISNAFKFTFEGEIAIVTRPSSDGSCAEVTIRDSGTGISPEELPHLFERFYRVEGARGRSIEGSGIGLAMVQELVRLHGGSIRIASQVEQGSAFTIVLPFGTAHLPAERISRARTQATTNVRAQAYVEEALGWVSDGSATGRSEPPPPSPQDLGDVAAIAGADGQLVLVADDNADMRNYVQRILRAGGFRVEAVTDGKKALAAARWLKPDLVLSDVMMPELDGFELLTAFRKDPELRDTPVLLLSARAGEEAKVEGLMAGADDYLIKPFSARELLARVGVKLQFARNRRERAEALQAELARVTRLTTMGEMTASIAHEVNQPLMAIVTNADSCLSWLSRDAPEIDEARMAAERIVRDGHRAGDIIKTIRALARKSRLEMTQLDINDALAEVLALTRGELRRHDISLETELSDGLPPVLADRIQVQQVILNLVVNGIEAMNAILDRPRLLRVGSQIEGSGSIQIAVADTGTGLDPAKADRVFDAFFTTKPDGMGMGLSICRSIVGAHGGRIWASSNQPYGSVFQFSMPTITKGVSSDRLG